MMEVTGATEKLKRGFFDDDHQASLTEVFGNRVPPPYGIFIE